MFERFTDKGRKIIILAREEAERHQNDYLGTEHLVLAILRETDGIALMIPEDGALHGTDSARDRAKTFREAPR